VRVKAVFGNADGLLWPGAYVKVNLVMRTLPMLAARSSGVRLDSRRPDGPCWPSSAASMPC
jgi:hypothetical protein